MIDLVTNIDPQYYSAYLFSGMGLLHTHEDVLLSIPIVKKGMAIFPDSWELPFWIGLNAYLYMEDDTLASEYLWQAAHKPDAPSSFLSLLLSAITKGGNLQQGIWVLESMIKAPKLQGVSVSGSESLARWIDGVLAIRNGALCPLIVETNGPSLMSRFVLEKAVSNNTTASGGNASLLAMGDS